MGSHCASLVADLFCFVMKEASIGHQAVWTSSWDSYGH